MDKAELVAALAESMEVTKKEAEKFLKTFEDVVTEELKKGGKVQLVGFGTFEVRSRSERQGRDPRTNNPITIPASKAPAFKAGKAFKDAVDH